MAKGSFRRWSASSATSDLGGADLLRAARRSLADRRGVFELNPAMSAYAEVLRDFRDAEVTLVSDAVDYQLRQALANDGSLRWARPSTSWPAAAC